VSWPLEGPERCSDSGLAAEGACGQIAGMGEQAASWGGEHS
jgi:hypothetical protein